MGYTIKQINKKDRPREHLLSKGAESLTNAELLAIILRTGTKEENALVLSQNILNNMNFRELAKMSAAQLQKIKGIGKAKACALKACFEISNRLNEEEVRKNIVEGPEDAVSIVAARMKESPREVMKAILLNAKKQVIAVETISTGTNDSCLLSARDVVKKALEHDASAVIIVHNHPGFNPLPSEEDKKTTKEVEKACSFFNITLLDHLIITSDHYYSFKETGLL